MTGIRKFTDLQIWQRSRKWAKRVFEQTRQDGFTTDKRLVTQINDSAASVMANIAEGFGRGTQGEFVQFLGYSIGSLNETQSHLCVAYDRQYILKSDFAELFQEGTEIRKMMIGFLQSMVMPGSGVKHKRKYVSWTDQVWETYERLTGKERPELFRPKTDNDNNEQSKRLDGS